MRSRKNIRMKKSNRKNFKRTKSQRKIRSRRRNYRGGSNSNRTLSPNRPSNRTLSQNNTSLKTKLQDLIASNIQTLIPEFDASFNIEIINSNSENGNDLLLLVKSGGSLDSLTGKNTFLCVFDKGNNFLVLYPQIFKNDDSNEIIEKRLKNIKNDLELYLKNEEMVLPLDPENDSEFNEYKTGMLSRIDQNKDIGKVITQKKFTNIDVNTNNIYENPSNPLKDYSEKYDFFHDKGHLFLERYFKYLLKKSIEENSGVKRKHKEYKSKICTNRRKINVRGGESESLKVEQINLNIESSQEVPKDFIASNIGDNYFKEQMNYIDEDNKGDYCDSDDYKYSKLSFPYESEIQETGAYFIERGMGNIKFNDSLEPHMKKIRDNIDTCKDRYFIINISLTDKYAEKRLREGNARFSHANTLVFDLKNKRIIRIEPHGFNKETAYKQDQVDCLVKKMLYVSFLKDGTFTFVNEAINMGEYDNFFKKEISIQGHGQEICFMVSSLVAFLSILYPKYTIAALNKVLQQNIKTLFIQFLYTFFKFLEEIQVTVKKSPDTPDTSINYICKIVPSSLKESDSPNSLKMNLYELLRESLSTKKPPNKLCPLNFKVSLEILDAYINEDYKEFEYIYSVEGNDKNYKVSLNGIKEGNTKNIISNKRINIRSA